MEKLPEISEETKEKADLPAADPLYPKIGSSIILGERKKATKFDLLLKSNKIERKIFEEKKSEKDLVDWDHTYSSNSVPDIKKSIIDHLEYTLAMTRYTIQEDAGLRATSFSVRDRLIESWNDTNTYLYKVDPKRVYYLSLEYLMGRQLKNALINLGVMKNYEAALKELNLDLNKIYLQEVDPALGNGGLGRLAACYLDSMATLELPAWGYGIRYNYGLFKQKIVDGRQVEIPDYWLTRGNPWEIERIDVTYKIGFYGKSNKISDIKGQWTPSETVIAMAYDIPVQGYNTFNTNNLRLWKSCPSYEFDLNSFNSGDYFQAVAERQKAETISSVLYPNDSKIEGKALRLKQEYFFISATLQDIIRRFRKKRSHNWKNFPEKVAIQLNDTHPTLAIIELFRILIDEENMNYQEAWDIVYNTFAYTNHTVLPEALEKWPIDLFASLLPRHLEIVYLINFFFIESIKSVFPGNSSMIERLSFIDEAGVRYVRMANICVACSHKVNGVAAIHSRILKEILFKDFVDYYKQFKGGLYKDKFINITNGVTPRRFVVSSNPGLSELITSTLKSDAWINDMIHIRDLEKFADNKEFRDNFDRIKKANKERLVKWVYEKCGITISSTFLFDIMVKRIHEYKRQLMNLFYVVHRYLWIKDLKPEERAEVVPRVTMIGGKVAPGYAAAKNVIKLIHNVANVINQDHEVKDLLKLVFLPNYSVSNAEIIVPATELSQQISTAGTEASGTGNMKFAMNGGLIIGTMDGANIEIAEQIGKENMFIFGADDKAILKFRQLMREGKKDYAPPKVRNVVNAILNNKFGNFSEIYPMLSRILNEDDFYCLCWDFESYCEAQKRVDEEYKNRDLWLKKSILSVARMGYFSSDRSILEYAKNIWNIESAPVPLPELLK